MLLAPLVKEAAVAEGDVVGGSDAEAERGAVDPVGGAFEFGVVADGGFVNDAVALRTVFAGVGPFGAPFFAAECGDEAEGEKELGERGAVGDLGFGLNAMFVAGDQLLKGAALNAVQIAEVMLERGYLAGAEAGRR